ncbi:hypothetical protein IKF94_00880 [Candidatus Saccharibacteria bacterium]|nr:hypothetical protein [Candidatus Saccharibacteria bacterium]
MRETNEAIANRVYSITGLSGEALDFVVNAVTITAALGKFPTQIDACYYLGLSEHEMASLGQKAMANAWVDKNGSLKKWYFQVGVDNQPKLKAMVYAVATDLVARGMLEYQFDGDGRARGLLKAMFKPQQISSKAEFDGFLVTLEYLRHLERGLDTTLSQFLKLRYGQFRKHNALAAFAELVAGNDPESFPQSDYGFVINRLAELLEVCRD